MIKTNVHSPQEWSSIGELHSASVQLLENFVLVLTYLNENTFKIRAFTNATRVLNSVPPEEYFQKVQQGSLSELKGIGKGIEAVLTEFASEGSVQEFNEKKQSIPDAFFQFIQLPSVGASKAKVLIEELGAKSLAELEYACRENRLTQIKGFGEKAQRKILDGIQFLKKSLGKRLYSEVFRAWLQIKTDWEGRLEGSSYAWVGQLARAVEVLSELELIIQGTPKEGTEKLKNFLEEKLGLPVKFIVVQPSVFEFEKFVRSADPAWIEELMQLSGFKTKEELLPYFQKRVSRQVKHLQDQGEEIIFKSLSLPVTAREKDNELLKRLHLNQGQIELVELKDIRGFFHFHTEASDGTHTLEEMVFAAKEKGYQYVGVSDHSQTAFYAKGLKEKELLEQKKLIESVQKKIPEVKIFWGIESDILEDGSLDYSDSFLREFDFVIASIHSRFGMNEELMTARIVKAIENPFTTMVGHLTGRILLGRPPYALNMAAIIQAASKNNVILELNAHPSRLDVDWRWGAELVRAGVKISINPDAHEVGGIDDIQYGVLMSQKAGFEKKDVLNTYSTEEISKWLKKKKSGF